MELSIQPYLFTNEKTYSIPPWPVSAGEKMWFVNCLQQNKSCGLIAQNSIPIILIEDYSHVIDYQHVQNEISKLMPMEKIKQILYYL